MFLSTLASLCQNMWISVLDSMGTKLKNKNHDSLYTTNGFERLLGDDMIHFCGLFFFPNRKKQ